MKIALDFRALDGASKYRGIGIYLQSISRHLLPLLSQKHEVLLYVYDTENLDGIPKSVLKKCEVIEVKRPLLHAAPKEVRRLLAGIANPEKRQTKHLPQVQDCDIFFQPYHFMGLPKKIKSVVVAYDLIPYIFESDYFKKHILTPNPISWLLRLRTALQKYVYKRAFTSFRKADHILAISEQTKRDIMQFVAVPENAISTIYLGPPDVSTKSAKKDFLKSVPRPYVVFIGGIDGRRDLDSLLDGVQKSHELLGVSLVVVGRDFEQVRDQQIKELLEKGHNSESIFNLGFVSEAEKRTIIEESLAVVYPTFYEGFGLNILEAFEYGAPIITYKNSSLPEVGGEAALYAHDMSEMIRMIHTLKEDSSLRSEAIKAGKKQSKKFSWEKAAEQTASHIEGLR